MAKITAVIDIGSNSARMAVFEKTSRFGFHLVKEVKSKVRLSEGTYENMGYIQPTPIHRAELAILEFSSIIKSLKVRKVLCVATSALRDAPNRAILINSIKEKTGIHISIIDGEKEALFGAIATINLLPIKNGITVDIGGGSTECVKIVNGKIESMVSLNLGTIRLKELFFDKKVAIKDAVDFIENEFQRLPNEFFSDTVIGIGGTIRALSKSIMKSNSYPIDTIHGFEYFVNDEIERLRDIYKSKVLDLKKFSIKDERFDTIRGGTLIFAMILDRVKAERVITSGAGVREGAFLMDILRDNNSKFPDNFNPSLRALLDRFEPNIEVANYNQMIASKLFDILAPKHNLNESFREPLKYATKLSNIGNYLNYYNQNEHTFYFILNSLTYKISHKDKLLVAFLTKFNNKRLPEREDILSYEKLLPNLESLRWLSFIVTLVNQLNSDLSNPKVEISLKNNTLYIFSNSELYLAREKIKKIQKPAVLAIIFEKN